MSESESSSSGNGGGGGGWWYSAILVFVALVIVIWQVKHKLAEHEGEARTTPTQSAQTTQAPAPEVVKVGCVSQTYPMVDGEVRHTIKTYDFHIYPKGGCVMSYAPGVPEPYLNCPGVDVGGLGKTTPHPPGDWRWKTVAGQDTATGVEVCE